MTTNEYHRTVEDKRMIAALEADNARLREALEATLKPLVRLGDFIGNEDQGGASGLGPFDRCAIISQVKTALAQNNT